METEAKLLLGIWAAADFKLEERQLLYELGFGDLDEFLLTCMIAEEIKSCFFSDARWRCLPWTLKWAAQQTQADNLNFWIPNSFIFD